MPQKKNIKMYAFYYGIFFSALLHGMNPLNISKIASGSGFKLSLIAPHKKLEIPSLHTTFAGSNPYDWYFTIVPQIGHYNPQYDLRPNLGLIQLHPTMAAATIPDSIKQVIPFLYEVTRLDYTISFWGPYLTPPAKSKKGNIVFDEWYTNLVFHPWVRTWAKDDSSVKFSPPGQDIFFNVNVPMGIFEADGIRPFLEKEAVAFDTLTTKNISAHGTTRTFVTAQAAIFTQEDAAKSFLGIVTSDLPNFATLAIVHGAQYQNLEKISDKSPLEKPVRDALLKPKAPNLQLISAQNSYWVVHITGIEKSAQPDPENLVLMFSPNNAYFFVDKQRGISNFWTVAYSPNKKYLCLSYIVLINSDAAKNKLEEVFTDSITLGDFISNLKQAAEQFALPDKETLKTIAQNIRTIIENKQLPSSVPKLPRELIEALTKFGHSLHQLKKFL